jgi:hypothetical protein
VERGRRALEVAERLRHPYTEAYALFHVAFLDVWRRDWASVEDRARAVLAVADEHDYHVWRALGLVFVGLSTTALGDDAGLDVMERGFGLYSGLTTPPVFWPLLLSVKARALAIAGRPEEGHVFLDEALGLPGGGPNILHPELPMLKGDLHAAASRLEEAEPWFRRALELAEASGARMSLLRAATRLTALHRTVASGSDEVSQLAAIYATFTEGHDGPDLARARELLDDEPGQMPFRW